MASFVLPVIGVATTILSFAGQMQQASAYQAAAAAQQQAANAQLMLGRYNRQVAESQARVMEQQAGQERAASQRAAIEERRRGELVSSRAQAIAAASGAGALDPSVVNILGDIDREVELRALTSLYEGEEQARGLEFGGELERARGRGAQIASAADAYGLRSAAAGTRARATASRYGAFGTLLSGGASLYEKYWPQD